MSNKSYKLLWIKIQSNKNKHFNLPFPIPMFVLVEILDGVLDLFTLICLFVPKEIKLENRSTKKAPTNVHAIKELISFTINLLYALTDCEPFDLVDVQADEVRVLVKIK